MEFAELSKIIFGVVTAMGTIALTYFNMSQTRKITAELLEKFEVALEKKQKNSVTELFRLIHGLRMNYTDICELISDDNCSQIIYSLKKTPGLVCYQDGSFQYTSIGQNKLFKFIDKWVSRFGVAAFSLFIISGFFLLAFSDGSALFFGFVIIMLFSFMLGRQLRENRHNQLIDSLVNSEYNKSLKQDK